MHASGSALARTTSKPIARTHVPANLLATIAVACAYVEFAVTQLQRVPHQFFAFEDLRAFYCAARTARAGFDPYAAEPIGACERALVGLQGTNLSLPAPLPGHALALLHPLATLPFPAVAAVWCVLLGAAYVVLCVLLARVTGAAYILVLAACMPLALVVPLVHGQIVPFAVLPLVAAAYALERGGDAAAALLAALATIEPHIGLPVCVALFVARPRTRRILVLAAIAGAVTAAAAVGPAHLVEYAARVLPEHVRAEARFDAQYSLTYALRWIGVPESAALSAGQLSYWLGMVAAVAAARRLARARSDPRYLVFVPMAVSVTGGPYVHDQHLLAAVPLAMLLLATQTGAARVAAACALALVALPLLLALRIAGVHGLGVGITTAAVSVPLQQAPLLAEAAWAARIAPDSGNAAIALAKIPTWIGLLLLAAQIVRQARAAARRA